MTMKLGAALSKRAQLSQRLEDLRARLQANALTQEGDEPAEDPGELITEFERTSDELGTLVQQITRTNVSAEATNGDNLLVLLTEREKLRRKRNVHQMVASKATPNIGMMSRYMRSELRVVSQVDVQEHRNRAEVLEQAIRELDAIVQETNWQIDLVE